MAKINKTALLEAALKARQGAYAPYSKYKVGAAVLGKSGKIYGGANVENASYGLVICAERTAIFKAITEGEKEILAIAIVTADIASPCGACRQVMAEFMAPSAPVLIASDNKGKPGAVTEKKLRDYYPFPFDAASLKIK